MGATAAVRGGAAERTVLAVTTEAGAKVAWAAAARAVQVVALAVGWGRGPEGTAVVKGVRMVAVARAVAREATKAEEGSSGRGARLVAAAAVAATAPAAKAEEARAAVARVQVQAGKAAARAGAEEEMAAQMAARMVAATLAAWRAAMRVVPQAVVARVGAAMVAALVVERVEVMGATWEAACVATAKGEGQEGAAVVGWTGAVK